MSLEVLGLCLGAAGSFALLYGIVFKGLNEILDESAPFWRHNPFMVKGAIQAKSQAIAGSVLLGLGFLVSLAGSLWPALRFPEYPPEAGFMEHLVFPAIVTGMLTMGAIGGAQVVARRQLLKKLLPAQKLVLEQSVYVMDHDGNSGQGESSAFR